MTDEFKGYCLYTKAGDVIMKGFVNYNEAWSAAHDISTARNRRRDELGLAPIYDSVRVVPYSENVFAYITRDKHIDYKEEKG